MDKNLLASGTGIVLAEILTMPIYTIKTNFQTNFENKSIRHTALKLYHSRGLYCFYSASFMVILSQVVSMSIKYNLGNVLLASMCTSISTTIITHPIDYLKVRHIANQKLFQGFNPIPYYRGLAINLLRVIPNFMIMMCVTEWIKAYYNGVN